MELHENFRKINTEAQTEELECFDVGMCTEKTERLNCGIATQAIVIDEIGVNTIESNLPVKKAKTIHQKTNNKLRTDKSIKKIGGEKKKAVEFEKSLVSSRQEIDNSLQKKFSLSVAFSKESVHVQT